MDFVLLQSTATCSCSSLMCSLPEEEKVFRVLRELRERTESAVVRADVDQLEKLLNNPLFKQYSRKGTRSTPKVAKTDCANASSQLVQFLKENTEEQLQRTLKKNQKLHFIEYDDRSFDLEVLDPRQDDNYLFIAGPKDVKARSSGQLRIGDRIVAIASYAHGDNAGNPTGGSFDDESHHEGGAATPLEGAAAACAYGDEPLLIRSPQAAEFRATTARSANHILAIAVIRESINMVLSGDWTQVEMICLSTEGGGLGFGIVGGASTGVVVKTIIPGSPADKDHRLRPGDHVLQVGNVSTHGLSSQQVASILRQQDTMVRIIVGRPINYADRPPDTNECWTMSTRTALCAASLEEHLQKISNLSLPAEVAPSTVSRPASQEGLKELTCPVTSDNHATSSLASTAHDQLPSETTEVAQKNGSSFHSASPSRPSSGKDKESRQRFNSQKWTGDPKRPRSSSANEQYSSETGRSDSITLRKPLANGGTARAKIAHSTDPAIASKISLRTLQELALTVFLRENWENTGYSTIDVKLLRDPALGLGITVAGYVHRKEEIGGIFVKSLVPRSAAVLSGLIRVHDLILEVNGVSLEHLSHADSVRTLVSSGEQVALRLIRFPPDSLQTQCLKMLQEQETETQVIDVQSSNPGLVSEWKRKLSDDVDIITTIIRPDSNRAGDGGLGISLEGTVDVVKGHQLCPHHYIESIRQNGPAAASGVLQAGDELLQVNHSVLYGESHVTVRQALTRAVHSGAPVTLVVARRSQHVNVFQPTTERSLPASYPLLASGNEKIVKAKSEVNIPEMVNDTEVLLNQVSRRLRARSLEPLTGLAVWNCVPLVVCLMKDERGLGFSIVDYQDPAHPGESVIVVQSLVPGGLAQADGRIVPGDRLLFVNQHDLSNSSLERAVAVLKAAPMGKIRIGVAKPIPIDQCRSSSYSPIFTRSERLLARGSSPRGRRRQVSQTNSSQETVWVGIEQYRRLHPQSYYPSRSPSCTRSGHSLNGSDTSMMSWSPCSTRSPSPARSPVSLKGSWAYDVVYLPAHLERNIKINKGALTLGFVLDATKDKGVNGAVVKSICGKKAIGLDGRIQVGDYIVRVNQENLRNVTSSQARAILRRTNLIGTQCNVTYITAADARVWKERFHREDEVDSPVINRLSPKVFPKFYRSPYLSRKDSLRDNDDTEPLSYASEIANVHSSSEILEIETKKPKESDVKPLDPSVLDNFVLQIIQEVFRDAFIEFLMSNAAPDWKAKLSRTHSEASTSQGILSRTSQQFPPASSSGSQLGSPDRHGSPPYTILRKESLTSKSSRASETNSEPKKLSPSKSRPPSEASSKPSSPFTEDTKTMFKESEHIGTSECANIATSGPPTDHERMVSKAPADVSTTATTSSTGSENTFQQAKLLVRSKFWGEARTVVLQREPNKSFGISIVGGRVEVSQKGGLPGTGNTVSGIFIKSVLPNSPAGKSGLMNMGDRVISVNDIDLREATHEQAVNAIKNATNPVRFVLQSLHTCIPQHQINNSASNSMATFTMENVKPEEQAAVKVESTSVTSEMNEYPKKLKVEEEEKEKEKEQLIPTSQLVNEQLSSSTKNRQSEDSEKQNNSNKESTSDRRQSVPKPDANSHCSNEAVSTMKRDSLRSGEFRKESGTLIVSDVSSSEAHEDEPSTSTAQFDPSSAGVSSSSAAQLEKSRDDDELESIFGYTDGKIKRKYGHLSGSLMLVSCERVPEAGLGISLAGNRDREKNNTFVLGVKVQCPLTVRAGDELLEVNGQVLVGHSHLVASSIIRQCCEKGEGLEFVVCRRDDAMDDVAIRSPEPQAAVKKDVTEPMPPTIDVSADTTLHNLENARKKSCGIERTATIETGRETLIEIDKDGKGLGLSIVGGSDTVLGTVVIHEVYPDGAAAHDARLKPGDQVLEVNNFSLRGVTHDQAISALRRTPPKVRLLIYRDVNLQLSLLDPTQIYNIFEVELVKKPGRGLGLSIVGRKNEPGVYVSEVVKGGAAEADNRLMTGDQILAVNGQDVANSMQEDVAAMLKTCIGRVCLKVGRWKITETANRVHAAAEAALAKSQTNTRTDDSQQSSVSERWDVPSPAPPLRPVITHTSPEGEAMVDSDVHLSPVTEEPSSGADTRSLLEEDRGVQGMELLHDLKEEGSDTLLLELKKIPDQQLGMGIGKRSRGILVTSLQPGSVAAEKLKVGDRILAVNALPVTDQLSAVTFVKASGSRLFLQIARPRTSPQ